MFLTFGIQSIIKAPIMAVYAVIKIIGKGWQWSLATAITIAIIVVLTSYGIICAVEAGNGNIPAGYRSSFLFFECFSAFGTVGLSANVTPHLQWGSKIVIILLMFIGRLGPMTMFQVFQTNMDKKSKLHYSYVEEDFLIG